MPPTILLLDDDAQFRTSVTPALEAFGLRVVSATKGSIARALIDEDEPALLVVDGLLPDTNGIVWIEELRAAGLTTPIIFVSAFYRDLTTFKHLTRDLGVLKVFHKPVAVDRFAREVASFEGMLVELARERKARAVIRGLRVISDFEYEFQMALMNRRLSAELETIFLMPRGKYIYLSSRLVKEVASLGGEVPELVPEGTLRRLRERYGKSEG